MRAKLRHRMNGELDKAIEELTNPDLERKKKLHEMSKQLGREYRKTLKK